MPARCWAGSITSTPLWKHSLDRIFAEHSGDAIPLEARIFAFVDVYDALPSRRPYKEPLAHDAAMSMLEQGRGSHFDPRLLDAFAAIARPLFDQLANRDDEPRQAVADIVRRYFRRDLAALFNSE